MTEWGEWIDDPWRLVRSDEYWDKLVDRGVRTADLMIDTSRPAWDPMFTIEQVEHFSTLAIEHDIEPVALGWPTPCRSVLDPMLADFEKIAEYVAALGLDTEGTWQHDDLDGSFRSLGDAAEYLLAGLYRLRERFDVRIEVTAFPGHGEASSSATLTPYADRFYLQSYSTRHDWRGDEVDWGARYAPGVRQRLDIERVVNALPCLGPDGPVKLCLGQALWDVKFPGHSIDEALDEALDAALAANVTSVRGWSSKWDVGCKSGSLRQQEVSKWVRGRFRR